MKRIAIGFALLLSLLTIFPAGAASGPLKEIFYYTPTTTGGLKIKAQVNLTNVTTDALDIGLSSSNPSLATVPNSVTVPAGKKYVIFYVTTAIVSQSTDVTITATAGSQSVDRAFTLREPGVSTLTVPARVVGGYTGKATIKLTGPAGEDGVDVALSTTSDLIEIPDFVSVAPGATSASFVIQTFAVSAPATVSITASAGGRTITKGFIVDSVTISTVTMKTASVKGGKSVTGTVKLNAVATSDVVVTLSGNQSAASVPSQVTVPAGQQTATFTVSTSTVSVKTKVTVSATQGSTVKKVIFTVNP